MDGWQRLLGHATRVGAIGLAALLVLFDLALEARVAVASGVIVAALALLTFDLRQRILLALAVSVAVDVIATTQPAARSFGLAETAGLGLLLVLATRRLGAPTAWWLVPALSLAVMLLPQRLGPEQAGLTFILAFCVLLAIALGALLRTQDNERASALSAVRSDERLSLARDLHDSVAHHVTGIVVRAQAAQVVAADQPDEAVAALAAIEREGLATLMSMRRLVGVLRDDHAERRPPAGLTQVRDLIARFDATGPPTTLSASPAAAAADIPDEVGAALHRVVQEALTNVRRHAERPSHVVVEIDADGAALHVRVRDDGHEKRPTRRRGFGLVGLEERVRALGGRFRAGAQATGGWEVTATLPLTWERAHVPAALPGLPPRASAPRSPA